MKWFTNKKNKESEEAIKIKALKDSTDTLIKGLATVMAEVSRSMNENISNSSVRVKNEIISEMNKIETKRNMIVNGEYSAVYAFYFVRKSIGTLMMDTSKVNFMLTQVIAKSKTDAVDKAKDILIKNGLVPSEWEAFVTSKIDIFMDGKKVEYNKPIDADFTKVTKKIDLPIDTYVTNLLYARDCFAKTVIEKGVITRIINRIKIKHDSTNAA